MVDKTKNPDEGRAIIPLTLRAEQNKQLTEWCRENKVPRLTLIKYLLQKYTGISMFHRDKVQIEFTAN